jgi:hypothetical protein
MRFSAGEESLRPAVAARGKRRSRPLPTKAIDEDADECSFGQSYSKEIWQGSGRAFNAWLIGLALVRIDGKTKRPAPESWRISVRIASACRDNGTVCGWRIFILAMGMIQSALSKSTSLHSI